MSRNAISKINNNSGAIVRGNINGILSDIYTQFSGTSLFSASAPPPSDFSVGTNIYDQDSDILVTVISVSGSNKYSFVRKLNATWINVTGIAIITEKYFGAYLYATDNITRTLTITDDTDFDFTNWWLETGVPLNYLVLARTIPITGYVRFIGSRPVYANLYNESNPSIFLTAGTVYQYINIGYSYIITASSSFAVRAIYTIFIRRGVPDGNGNIINQNYEFSEDRVSGSINFPSRVLTAPASAGFSSITTKRTDTNAVSFGTFTYDSLNRNLVYSFSGGGSLQGFNTYLVTGLA